MQTAEVLFFVIDNQTRSVASIIEAAYLAGQLGAINILLRRKRKNSIAHRFSTVRCLLLLLMDWAVDTTDLWIFTDFMDVSKKGQRPGTWYSAA